MWLAVLGPLLVHDGEAPVDVPQGRLRVLLTALLLHAGKPVAADTLAEVVWDGSPPPGAAVTLRSYVLRLRRVLGPRAGARLVTRHPGYLLQAGEDEVDVLRFRSLCRDGSATLREGAWARADGLLDQALALWRGAPLADVPSELLLREEVPGLEELRLQAEERRADAALHLGRHDQLVAGLQALATEHPLRERFHAQLMLALYRCGRQAEALAAYQHARHVLIDEVGTEPGPELRRLHQQVLSADPALAAPEPAPPTRGAGPSVIPRELPLTAPHFTGRTQELARLTGLLDRPGQQVGTVVISAIGGTAGVGKTALAVRWAHQVAGRFPDGQLYVNLRGHDPGQPVPAAEALAGLLHSLGVPGPDIPPEEDQRAARYRSLLSGKRMLVVLDNAGSADQVRPLLPGTSACAVVVTSRDALAGLVARDGAARLDLDVLPLEEAVALLRALIGARVDAEPGAAAELAAQCCRLPLALRVAAELAASRPTVPLAGLAGELADLRTRLDLLAAGGDPSTQVRAVLSWSYRHLGADEARAFRLLGLHPGPEVGLHAAAALTGTTVQQARRALDMLVRAHLLSPVPPGRYSMHDLLRGYARELAHGHAGEQGREPDSTDEPLQALIRMLDYYLHTARAAAGVLQPEPGQPPLGAARPGTRPEDGQTQAQAMAWFAAERRALLAVTVTAADAGSHVHAWMLPTAMAPYLSRSGHWDEWAATQHTALAAARELRDPHAQALVHCCLGHALTRLRQLKDADTHLRRATHMFRTLGDPAGEADACLIAAEVPAEQERHREALHLARRALQLFRQAGNKYGEARALNAVGWDHIQLGDPQQGLRLCQQALQLCREIGSTALAGAILDSLGLAHDLLGQHAEAISSYRQAIGEYQRTGHRRGEADTLTRLGDAQRNQGDAAAATHSWHQALDILTELHHPDTAAVRRRLGL